MGAATSIALVALSAIQMMEQKKAGQTASDQAKAQQTEQEKQNRLQAQQAEKQDILARNEMEAGLEDVSGGPRLRSVAQGQESRRVRRDTLTPKGLGIPSQGRQGLQTGYNRA